MSIDRLERRLPEVLTELALPRIPDYVDELLDRTAAAPQRPAWSFPERWFPLSTMTATLPGFRRTSPRLLFALVALVALIAASIAVYIGSQTKLPPLFGVARNGLVVTHDATGVVVIDPATGARRTLFAGQDLCCVEIAPDGQRIAYLTVPVAGDDPTAMTVARLDGTVLRTFDAATIGSLNWIAWSPTDNGLLLTRSNGGILVDLSSGRMTDVAMPANAASAVWIGTSGDLLVTTWKGEGATIHAYRVTPGSSAAPVEIPLVFAAEWPVLSPDATKFAYDSWGPGDGQQGRIHVVDLATGKDVAITPEGLEPADDLHQFGGAAWSPDGSWISVMAYTSNFDSVALLPAGGGAPRYLGPKLPLSAQTGADDVVTRFSPDGTSLLATYRYLHETWLLPLDGSPGRTVPWEIGNAVDWQRLAP
jgi:hypothetical protein